MAEIYMLVGRITSEVGCDSIPYPQHSTIRRFSPSDLPANKGRTAATYSAEGGRVALSKDPAFAQAFTAAKARIRQMELRFVEENDPRRQALLEIYAAIALNTPHNDFETH